MSRELTREEKAVIRKLVTKWCANYDKEYGCLSSGQQFPVFLQRIKTRMPEI